MADEKPDILVVGAPKPVIVNGLAPAFTLHRLSEAKDRDSFLAGIATRSAGSPSPIWSTGSTASS